MPVLGFINDLSMPNSAVAAPIAREAMATLARIIRDVRRWRLDFALQTHEPIKAWRLGNYFSFAEFMNDPATRDLARLILSTMNRAPIRYGLDLTLLDEATLEYAYAGKRAEGLGLAHVFDGLAISFFGDAAWASAVVEVDRTVLEEGVDGQLTLNTMPVSVRHVSLPEHVTVHQIWLEKAGKSPFASFQQFQAERADRLSRINFLNRALDQLTTLNTEHPWWSAVMARLDELQEAMMEWDPAATPQPAWRSHVTGEMETRRRLCNFVDLDGQTRCFDQHARFTPGAGRIHFRLDGAVVKLIVAHIGRKID